MKTWKLNCDYFWLNNDRKVRLEVRQSWARLLFGVCSLIWWSFDRPRGPYLRLSMSSWTDGFRSMLPVAHMALPDMEMALTESLHRPVLCFSFPFSFPFESRWPFQYISLGGRESENIQPNMPLLNQRERWDYGLEGDALWTWQFSPLFHLFSERGWFFSDQSRFFITVVWNQWNCRGDGGRQADDIKTNEENKSSTQIMFAGDFHEMQIKLYERVTFTFATFYFYSVFFFATLIVFHCWSAVSSLSLYMNDEGAFTSTPICLSWPHQSPRSSTLPHTHTHTHTHTHHLPQSTTPSDSAHSGSLLRGHIGKPLALIMLYSHPFSPFRLLITVHPLVCMCARARVRVCVCACVHALVCVAACIRVHFSPTLLSRQ